MGITLFLIWQLLLCMSFLAGARQNGRQIVSADMADFERVKYDVVANGNVNRKYNNNKKLARNFKNGGAMEELEELFTVFDPYWSARLWPKLKNGLHMSVHNACWHDVGVFMKDLAKGRAWTLNVIDSSGKYEGGLRWGNHFWLGSKQYCQYLDNQYLDVSDRDTVNELRQEHYLSTIQRQQAALGPQVSWNSVYTDDELLQRVLEAHNIPPYGLSFSSVLLQLNVSRVDLDDNQEITLGMCMPKSCQPSDLREILEFNINLSQNLRSSTPLPRTMKILSVRQLDGHKYFYSELTLTILIVLMTLVTIFTILGTVLDMNIVNFKINTRGSLDIQNNQIVQQPALATTSSDTVIVENLPNDKISHKHFEVNKKKESMSSPMDTASKANVVTAQKYKDINRNLNFVDMQTLAIHDIRDKQRLNLIKMKKTLIKSQDGLSMNLAVHSHDSCQKCGKYRKQCYSSRRTAILNEVASGENKCGFEENDYDVVGNIDFGSSKVAILRMVLVSFSIKTNFRRIFNTNLSGHNLDSMHGMKVLSVFWILYAHMCLVMAYISGNKTDKGGFNQTSLNRLINGGTYAYDTLFLISGLLSAHHYHRLKDRCTTVDLVSIDGAFGKVMEYTCYIFNKTMRLLPPYIITIYLAELAAKGQVADHVILLPTRDDLNCKRYWWRNLLYVNNFYPSSERCLHWSWYISQEIQLHIIGVSFMMLSSVRFKLATACMSAFVVSSLSAAVVIAYTVNFDIGNSEYAYYDAVFNMSWARVGPYFTGLATGWVLYKIDCKYHFCKLLKFSLWIVALVIMLVTSQRMFGADFNLYGLAAYTALSHTLWALPVAWICIVCCTGNAENVSSILSHRFLYPLSRISYCLYLIHPLVIQYVLLSGDSNIFLTSSLMITKFFGISILSTLAAILLSLLVEAPFIALLRLLQGISRERTES